MSDETLTFSDLRKIEKEEKRQEELSDLGDNFLLKVSQYLDMKKDVDDREYRNAKRVFNKILGLRQEKIVKNARLAVKSDVKASDLELLPREQELYREMKQKFEEYSGKIDDVINGDEQIEIEEEELDEKEEEIQEEAEEEDSYQTVEIVSDVPEFMGTDLESYGPFEEGEEVEIPEDNAEILINRGNAEAVE